MIVSKLRMQNFRGYHDITINFEDKSVVLLSAANGIGKTTVIDAIEWCLTGEIGRLKNAFDSRSTNGQDRKLNTSGILKNRSAGKNEAVRVFLWLTNNGKEIVLCREQAEDILNPNKSRATIDNDEDKAQEFFNSYVGDSFYNFHICDVQKTFNVQSKKRDELEAFFSEFITNYDHQRQIVKNLQIFEDDVDRYIEDKSRSLVSQEKIQAENERLSMLKDKAKLFDYPQVLFFKGENPDVVSMNKEELINQKSELENCGYLIARKNLSLLIENESLSYQKSLINEMKNAWEQKKDSIRRAINADMHKSEDVYTKLETKHAQLTSVSLSKENIFSVIESVVDMLSPSSFLSNIFEEKKSIQEKEEKLKKCESSIDLLSRNNKMLKLLSFLTANRETVIMHRNRVLSDKGIVRCPICGSESFATIEESKILYEANEYIKENGDHIKSMEEEKIRLQSEIDNCYEVLIKHTTDIIYQERNELATEITKLKTLYEETTPFFLLVKKLANKNVIIDVDNISTEKIEGMLIDLDTRVLAETAVSKLRETCFSILSVLGYSAETETFQQTYEKVNNRIGQDHEVTDFSYNVFVSKLNAIESVLANQELSDCREKLENDMRRNQVIESEIDALEKLKDEAKNRREEINGILDELSREEYSKIGPALTQYYKKLIRLDSVNEIQLLHEKQGMSLIDDKGKVIVNVLSGGQISVFLLAYFFAGIDSRNKREQFKVYFIDDLTAFMDDVNMLAFMDLLKYQMTTKENMEQLFFVTCDSRISNLLKYKLESRKIEICELDEERLSSK